uniref:Rhophilin Rho GTPase binding protein 1 n=1 Tax=Buteo japonicus TaxID=224669 RepID=A0A8C0BMM6_9AVES
HETGGYRHLLFPETQRSKLQHRRARINQQINKEMRMRAGAENLFRATSNHKVKETVALELSYVNSNLQLLKEELEELNSSMDVYQNDSESISVPMIPLGLKETKELDLLVPLKDLISEHYGEEGILFEKEIKEFMELRQAMRTPSRNEAGLELLMEYYNQLYFLDSRFFPPTKSLGVFFHWYDSLTGVPSHQRALAFEKGSVLFNIGALHTQIGARQDRASLPGLNQAIDAFQKAAGAFNYLKENFSNAPSLDMSAASLNMLVRLMVAQVQECVFEKMTLLRAHTPQERTAYVYSLVHQTMTQAHVKDYVPFSWTTMVHVKSEHFKALSHYFAAIALCDCPGKCYSSEAAACSAKCWLHVVAWCLGENPCGQLPWASQGGEVLAAGYAWLCWSWAYVAPGSQLEPGRGMQPMISICAVTDAQAKQFRVRQRIWGRAADARCDLWC